MDTKIITFEGASPQFLMTYFDSGGRTKFMMVYTGTLGIGHGAGQDQTQLRIEYPLLAWDKDQSGNDTLALYPFDDPDALEAAVASVAPSHFWIKDTKSWVYLDSIRADIKRVGIRRIISFSADSIAKEIGTLPPPPGTPPQKIETTDFENLLVLSMVSNSLESHIAQISYNVTVVGTFSGRRWSPILLGDWTGRYDVILNPPVKEEARLNKASRMGPTGLASSDDCIDSSPDRLIDYLPSLLNQTIQYYSCFISYSLKDDAVMESHTGWSADIRWTRHIWRLQQMEGPRCLSGVIPAGPARPKGDPRVS